MPSPRKDVQINLRVPPEMAEKVDQEARKTRTNRSWVIREALHQYFLSKREDDATKKD